MAAQALYRRWRPQTFDDVIGQEPVTRTLRNAVATGRLAHAYLFTGVRGTGKTTMARIMAKAVNCTGDGDKPCNVCAACVSITEARALDLIEIDAASNTGVDDVRDLRDKIGFSPNELKYKVYIIDEVHMLSTAAFNALLKTLEEPPAHAIFILATTEPHKVPDTIVSRCQRHDFKRVPRAILVSKLARICTAEGIDADPAALELVARGATGSFRDAESLLDQILAAGDGVTVDSVRMALGTPTDDVVAALADAITDGDAAAGLGQINAALDQGVDPRQLQGRILDYLRQLLLLQLGVADELLDMPDDAVARMRAQAARLSTPDLTRALHRFNDARPSPDRTQPALPLELALVETVLSLGEPAQPAPAASGTARPQAAPAQAPALSEPPPRSTPTTIPKASPVAPTTEPAVKQVAEQTSELESATTPVGGSPSDSAAGPPPASPTEPARPGRPSATSGPELARVQDHWQDVLTSVKAHDWRLAALLKDCRPVSADAETVTLGFYYQFHYDRAADPQRSRLIAEALGQVLGSPRKVVCTMVLPSPEEDATRPRTRADQARTDPVIRHAVENLGAQVTGVQRGEDGG
jgi:DNA polymerase-3 subunit gamma/tau